MSRNPKATAFFEDALQNPTNMFITIHGAPLALSADTKDESKTGIVPNNCILILITPPQAVVFSSPVEDTETYRFFQQKNWIKTLLRGASENCYGADRYVSKNADERVEPLDPNSESDSGDDDDSDSDSDGSSDSDGKRVGDKREFDEMRTVDGLVFFDKGPEQDIIHAKIRTKNGTPDSECEDTIIYSTKENIEEHKKMMARTKSNDSEKGFELLNNIQIFLPGDEFYNQYQEFDAESKDFNAYYLGPLRDDYRYPPSGNPQDEALVYPYFQIDGAQDGTEILVSKVKDGKNVAWQKGQTVTTVTHKTANAEKRHIGANFPPYFNRDLLPKADHKMQAAPKTTQQLLDLIMGESAKMGENWSDEKGKDLPKIVILNSCSPSKEPGKKKSASYARILDSRRQQMFQDMKENLALRGRIYWQGRKRFCALRNLVKPVAQPQGVDPVLPYWEGHNQFTRIDEEDLASTHKFIGDLFNEEDKARNKYIGDKQLDTDNLREFEIEPLTFGEDYGQELFFGLYTAAATDRRQTIMKQLREYWSNKFGPENEEEWSWEKMVDKWEEMRRQPQLEWTQPQEGNYKVDETEGGNKKRKTRRRRKTRKKRKKRTRKRTRKKKKRRRKKKRRTRRKKK